MLTGYVEVRENVPFGGKMIPAVRFLRLREGSDPPIYDEEGGYLNYVKPSRLKTPKHWVFVNHYKVGGFYWGICDWRDVRSKFQSLSDWFIENIHGDFAMWQREDVYGMWWAFERLEEATLFRLKWA